LEAVALTDYDDEARAAIFSRLNVPFAEARDLEGFENFVYAYQDRIIRITHDSHRTREQLLGELEFLAHLKANGANVASPLLLEGDAQLTTIGRFHICVFEMAAGNPAEGEFEPELIREWGRSIGAFHRLSRTFDPGHKRQNWRDDDNHRFAERIPRDQEKVHKAGEEVMRALAGLSESAETYGLIHSDAHPGNFVHQEGRLTFFDFDDCLYTWFGYDVATILFTAALRPWVSDDEPARVKAVSEFLPVFLDGYCQESPVEHLMLDQMQLFLKLREFSLYAVIYAHMDPKTAGDWYINKFMDKRKQRLEDRAPFLDMDFSLFA
jgi:Ser/Thr protein kinase RdoA (MazF antagonist)